MKVKFFLILAFLLLAFIRLEKMVILISSRFPFFILVPSLFLLIIISTLVIVLIKKFTFSEFFKLAKRNLVYISVLFLSCLSIFLILSLNNKLVLNKNLSYPIVKLPSDFATSSDLVRNGVLYIDNSKQKNIEITSGPYVHLPD